ncbi:MAG: EAL domain-containing protein [Pseudomonadota bacterium]
MALLYLLLYLTIGGAGAAGAHFYGGYDPVLSGIGGTVAALLFSQAHLFLKKSNDVPEEVTEQIDQLGTQVEQTNQRLDDLKDQTDGIESKISAQIDNQHKALIQEMQQLEGLIERLALSFESRSQAPQAISAPIAPPTEQVSPRENEALRQVKVALQEGRIDLHLQPVVSLPQRRVAFYEAYTRLRSADNSLIMPSDFLESARKAKLLGAIDNMTLFRCVQIVRKLASRDRRVGVFCNIAAASLEDETFFPQFLEFMAENRDLSGSVIFEIRADRFETRSRTMRENMERLTSLGFRFSIDHAQSLLIDLPRLQDAGVRFVKIGANDLINNLRDPDGPRPISALNRRLDAAGVSAVFARYGITLIAEKLEDEASVIEILEYDIPFGQGNVFGPPRPIKASLMQETTPPPEFMDRVRTALN